MKMIGMLATIIVLVLATWLVASPSNSAQADPGKGALFGTSQNTLINVNPTTGVGVPIGTLSGGRSFRFPSLALDPTTSILYAGGGGGNPFLHTVNPVTAQVTFVGNSGLGIAAIGGMDFRADGTLFAAVNIAGDGGTGSDHLATINTITGLSTVIGPFGSCVGVVVPSRGGGSCTIEGMEGIAFDASGRLWGSVSARAAAGAPGLYAINLGTGAATFVSPILDASGAPPSGGVVSLQFACDGTLYGGTATAIAAADGGRLVTINPTTGAFSFAGAVSATPTGRSLGSLAFQDPVCVIPVDIDIKPGSFPNSINPNSKGVIPVAILGSASFDVTDVDVSTLAFGPNGATPAHAAGAHLEDVNSDGFMDLVSHYRTRDTGIAKGDIQACVTGATIAGVPIRGCDSVRTVGK